MKFKHLVACFGQIEATASRLEITKLLSDLLADLDQEETELSVNILLGQLQPKFNKLEFSLAEKMVIRAIAWAQDLDPVQVTQLYKQLGDLGQVAVESKTITTSPVGKSSDLSITQVYNQLVTIAQYTGSGSQEQKLTSLSQLLASLDPASAKYVVRIVLGKLRLGFSDMTVLDALSHLITGDKSGRAKLEEAYQLAPDIGALARLVKQHQTADLTKHVQIQVGVPIIPALAQRLKTADEMIQKMGQVAVDPKYDGTRVQIHFKRQATSDKLQDWQVKTFTRNLDETSQMFPELENLGEFINADEVILDAEAIGYDRKTGRLLPFQQTIQRKRKHGIAQMAETIPLKFFAFDILYKDGQSLIQEPLEKRYQILKSTVTNSELIETTEFIVTQDAAEIRSKHADLLAQGLEGAMVKKWQGVYNPGRKGWSWVKFKEAEGSAAKLSDTVDALVMGLYVGKGKRTEFGVGAFLIGIKSELQATSDPSSHKASEGQSKPQAFEEGKFYTISKVGTGLTDEQWIQLKVQSEKFKVKDKPKEYEVDKNLEPDVWLDPGLVVEIAADEITKSPIHTARLALRFPRLVKFREDKSAQQVTSISELEQIV